MEQNAGANPQKNKKLVIFMPSGRRAYIKKGASLLTAAQEMGISIESICGGKLTCGKCLVQIEEGSFSKHGIVSKPESVSEAGKEEINLLKKNKNLQYRLSCQANIRDDVLVFIPEEARGQKQIIRKSATERKIDIKPAVKKYYIEVERAELGEHRGDWGRVQSAMEKQWGLTGLSIDIFALQKLQKALRNGVWKVTLTVWKDQEVIDVEPGYVDGVYGLAVDIGSTTIAAYLCDLRNGTILATSSMMNPQVSFGEDLMSRVSYAMSNKNGLAKLHRAVINAINQLAKDAGNEADIFPQNIHDIVCVGNTTMVHILLGINPEELGVAPFALANRDAMDIKARDLGIKIHKCANLHVLPAEAGHVGADNVAVLIAEEPYNQQGNILIVDIGTNAEIFLYARGKMYSASSPTGPAFEGAQITYGMRAAPGAIERVRIDPVNLNANFKVIGDDNWSDEWDAIGTNHLASGICGSGIIEAIAELFLAGVITPDGRFNLQKSRDRIVQNGRKGEFVLALPQQSSTGAPILVTQDDIRNIQLAKAALYAGAKLLMNRTQIDYLDRVFLAGAFGSYIDTKYAMVLGLIPNCILENVYAVGNAAGDGARIALLNADKRKEAQIIANKVKYIETAVDPTFQDEFVAALNFPHAEDEFPEISSILPNIKTQITSRPRKYRRK